MISPRLEDVYAVHHLVSSAYNPSLQLPELWMLSSCLENVYANSTTVPLWLSNIIL